ncbi:MAG: hypothetical protein SH820_05135 [Xanthomonadales bacterium]|nr:hypothetical protein [Xanthomonadales bacterium]
MADQETGNGLQAEISRRGFLEVAGTAAVGAGLAGSASAASGRGIEEPKVELVWGYLIHLGFNFWYDRMVPQWRDWCVSDHLVCETDFWIQAVNRMAQKGINMAVMDLGEGVQYRSHPELAVKGSWSRDQLRDELARMRSLGIEPIPKLNFSAAHDAWLGPYSRQVSTKAYYEVCGDIIAEVIELFGKPRFFHMGLDEENANNQRDYAYTIIRKYELWWHDFNFFVDQVKKSGVHPWMWSDYLWENEVDFFGNVPTTVLQSNWYYGAEFSKDVPAAVAYNNLEIHGYDQIPTGSNYDNPLNFGETVEYCQKYLSPDKLKGFLQTTWFPTVSAARDRHFAAMDQVAHAKEKLVQVAQAQNPKAPRA